MIQEHFHPADEVPLIGHTIHGLVKEGVSGVASYVVVDGVDHPLPAQYGFGLGGAYGVNQIVKHPGVGPVGLSPEVLAAERAEGRVWLNYAMIRRNGMLFGRNIGGWIYIDSLGRRWVVRPGAMFNADPADAYSLDLDCRPFGYLDGAPMEAVSIPIECSDLQQVTPGQRIVAIETVNGTGSRGILRLTPSGQDLPSGFLEIGISDIDGALSASFSVLKSQEDVRGTWSTTHPSTSSISDLFDTVSLCPAVELLGSVDHSGFPYFPDGGGEVSLSIVGLEEVGSYRTEGFALYSIFLKGDAEVRSGRSGRLLAMAFDESDVLVETTFDTFYEYRASRPSWSGTAVGHMTNSGDDVFINTTPWTVIEEPAVDVTRTISESVVKTIRVLRDGIPVVSVSSTKSYSADHQMGLVPLAEGAEWGYAYVGGFNDLEGVGARSTSFLLPPGLTNPNESVQPTTATASKGGPWPEDWITTPTSTVGDGDVIYTGDVPIGTVERDGDTLNMRFESVSYLIDTLYDGVRLRESDTRSGSTTVREISLVYPHAELLSRGAVNTSLTVAYHPVEHQVVVSVDSSINIFFV